MTILAGAPIVISTVAERSGEISRLNGQESGCGFRRRLCRRAASLRSGGDSACGAEGCGIALTGDEYKVSVTDLPFCVIWHDEHSAGWLATLASPYPASPDFSTGKRVTRFSGRFAPLRIVFPCHPCSGGRIKHLEASLRKRLYSKHGLLCHLEEGERWWRQPPKGDCISTPAGRLYCFRRQRRHKKWRPKGRPPRQRARSANQ